MEPRRLPDGTEPGPFIAWTADDGYGTQVDFFDLLTANNIAGTLFLTKNFVDMPGTSPSWNDDTFITTGQVEGIVAQGHEIGSHGIAHEAFDQYLATHGEAAFAALCDQMVDYIEDTFGVVVESGAYPAGRSNVRVREIVSRRHRWYRGTKGQIVRYTNDPFDVRSIDIQPLTIEQIKAHIDSAVAIRSPAVFLVHGGLDSTHLATIQEAIDYAEGLGIPQGTFSECMRQRVLWASPGFAITADGHVASRTLAATRLEIRRDDVMADWFAFDHDEATNTFMLEASSPSMRARLVQPVDFEHQAKFTAGGATSRRPLIQPAAPQAADSVGLFEIKRSDAETANPGAQILLIRQNGKVDVRGSQAGNFDFFDADGVLFTRYTNGGRTWQAAGGGGTMTIDSGSNGSNIDHKGFRHRFWDHEGNRRIALCTGTPADASLANGEMGIYFDPDAGSLKVKAKKSDGTIVTGELPLTTP